MQLSRRTVIAALGASPIAAPFVARAGTYNLKPVNDGFAAVLETKDFGALVAEPGRVAQLQQQLHKHLILHLRPEAPLTREVIGQMAYQLGYPKGGRAPAPRTPAPNANADGYGGQPASQGAPAQRPRGQYGEYSFIADFGGPAEPLPTAPRKPRYIETLHTDGGAYSVNVTIDVPPASPHTFADMQTAYRTLPRALKTVVEKSYALHGGLATTNTPFDELPAFDAKTALRRPMLLAHYHTKEPQLYLPKNPQSRIEGMPDDEAKAVLTELWARVNTQRSRYMAYSGANEAMLWDAFGTSHTNPSYAREKARVSWFFVIPSALPLTQAQVA